MAHVLFSEKFTIMLKKRNVKENEKKIVDPPPDLYLHQTWMGFVAVVFA